MKQHVVFGAGLIGGFLCGAIKAKGQAIKVVARPSVQEKLKNGLKLTDYQDNFVQVESPGFIEPEQLSKANASGLACDYLWLTVKCTDVENSLPELAPLIGPDTVIFCCQNGLGSDHTVKSAYPGNTVLRVMVQFNVAEITPGHLHRGAEGAISIEVLPDTPQALLELADLLDSSLMPVHTCDHMLSLLWAKLQLNLVNAVNALADIPIKSMLEQRDFRRIISLLMSELILVTDAKEISLPKVTALPAHWIPPLLVVPNFLFRILGNKMLAIDPTVRTSMWWDLSQRKRTEIDYLNGALVKEGEALGIECPANRQLVEMIRQAERGERQPGISAEELLKMLKARCLKEKREK